MVMNPEEAQNYQKFLRGNFLIKGWESRMKEILAVIPEQNKPEMKRLLADLGEKIGTEWAKHNTVRKIDSFMLQHWGSELKEAKKNGKNQLVEKIKEIDRKVDEILS
jgi:hypothetical protein